MSKVPPSPPVIPGRNLKQTSLSYSQESLWFLQQLDPGSIAYNSTFLWKFTGGIDRQWMQAAVNEVVRRHAPLRTVYPNRGGSPLQEIRPYEPFALPYLDLSGRPEDERQSAALAYVSECSEQPFDLQRGPLVRLALLHAADREDLFFLCTHHINSDAWSRKVFLGDLIRIYQALRSGQAPALPDLPIQYSDFASWQREWLTGETLAAYVDHWKGLLAGTLPILELPTDRPRPAIQSFRGVRHYFRFPASLASRIRTFCQGEKLTPFHLFLAAYAVLIKRYSGEEDIILGCPFANRIRPELDPLVGLFVNTLPIRLNLQGNPTVRELLAQVRSTMLDAFTWQAAPFEAVVSGIAPERDLSRTPVFQVLINLRNVPGSQAALDGLTVEELPRETVPSPFDLSLEFDEQDGNWMASLHYNADLFDEKTIQYMAAHFQILLGEILAKADGRIASLEMLQASEQKRIIEDWNATEAGFPSACVHTLFHEQALRDPEALAILCNGKSLRYGELDRKASQLAHHLRRNGVGAETRVGVFLPRSEEIVIVLLAILKAGGAYVPLDLTHPEERIAFLIRDSEPAAVVTHSGLVSRLPQAVRKICLDAEKDSIEACEQTEPDSVTTADSLAYVMYTSGSTGRPKGAMIVHRGIVNYLTHAARRLHFSPADRVVQLTSISFDLSVQEIFGTLITGGNLILMDDAQMRNPDFIYRSMIEHRATILEMVPTMLRAICESALAAGLQQHGLRLLLPAGEALHATDVALARRVFGNSVEIVNQYGPTECTIIHSLYSVPDPPPADQQVMPIGTPVSNSRTYILDGDLKPVPAGARGELFIGGVGVGRGYWNRPELTAEKFLPDPFQPGSRMYRTGDLVRRLPDGTLCFLGRVDSQVKIRGYRVELEEIEAVLGEFPGVREAAVTLRNREGGGILGAFVSFMEAVPEQAVERLHAHLTTRLPFYMVPAFIQVMDTLPHTPSGKLDRLSLPVVDTTLPGRSSVDPRNETERRLKAIWEEILGLQRVGVLDNFFELGGHSLLAVRLLTRIEQEFGQLLPLMLLFQEGTIAAQAAVLAGAEGDDRQATIVPLQPEGAGTPLFILTGQLYMRDLVLALGTRRPIYGLNPVRQGKQVFGGSVQETARIYRQGLRESNWQGPFLLLGHSAYGYFALELARLLQAEGKQVAFLGLVDSFAPGSSRKASLGDRVRVHINNIQGQDLSGRIRYFRQAMRRFLIRQTASRGAGGRDGSQPQAGRFMDIVPALIQAYHPDAYPGPVTLFSAERRPWYVRWDPMKAWQQILKGPHEIVQIPGDHMTMLQQPQAGILAARIQAALERDGID